MTYAKEKPRKHVCNTCNKQFLGSNDLRKHMRIHSNERPFICNECNRAFRQAGSLKNHIASQHSTNIKSLEMYVCDFCQKAFPIKERLRLHLRTHTGLKPYLCSVCPKSFARGGQLVQHMRTHTGSRPYICNICESSFTCSANLKSHIKRHQEIRDYVCDLCGKSFFRRDALKKHLNCYHANVRAFHCKICNKMLKGHLPQHMRLHRNEKPHGCAHCRARFAQRSQLTVHQRIHSGEKPYRCQVCWKAFAHSTALKLHTRRHTGEKPFRCILCDNVAFSQLPHLKKHMFCIHKSDKPYVCQYCRSFYRTKNDLEHHQSDCVKAPDRDETKVIVNGVEPPMRIEKMRLLLAVLLKKISAPERLEELGFNRKLIDDVLMESIEGSGREPCHDPTLSDAERLKTNVQILLDWTVPKHYMEKFKNEQRSTEELLEELTS
ncbi:zinc finger protein OZF-like [Agrilus planipennis]|uniref:Zinc finger protein OZF-like n=1 Tax=Agrilus planipennis TaxID=224129 RepID=A0A1W4WPW0_AGRPL|nr:zinc finger protein OZF-like [Agrilus planipennis]XP_018325949.1 zinc finger protein OZF-like [Agrilus planipennis]